MLEPSWKATGAEIHRRYVAGKWELYGQEDAHYLALSLAGEVGELCNIIKKMWRDGPQHDQQVEEVHKELADARSFLELLAMAFNCDLDQAVVRKYEEVRMRLDNRESSV